jgi:hypothetical protein
MAVVAVSDSNNRLDAAEATTNWSKIGSSLAQEPDFVYQGTYSVSSKIGTTLGGHYLSGGTNMPLNMSTGGADDKVLMMKQQWTNKDVLTSNPAAALRVGSTSANYYDYYIADDGTQGDIDYPPRGGWIISPVNPNVTAWRDGTVGTPNLASVNYIGTTGDFTAASKSENVVTDAVDVGDGLWLVGGDSTDPDGTMLDFVTYDEGTIANRFGHVYTGKDEIVVSGRLVIGRTSAGTVTATVFTDSTKTVVFPGGRVDAGWNAMEVDLGNASTVCTWNYMSFVGLGRSRLKRWFDSANEVDGTNEELDITAHGFSTGDAVLYSDEGGTAVTGLTDATEYWVEVITDDSICLHTSRQNAYTAATPVGLTAAGTSEQHSLTRQPDTRFDLDVIGANGSGTALGCVFRGGRELTAVAGWTYDGCLFVGCSLIDLAGALTDCIISESIVPEGVAVVETSDPEDITGCEFIAGEEGHAVECDTAGTYDWLNNSDSGYGPAAQEFNAQDDVDDTNDEVDITGHGFSSGDPVYYSDEGGTAITGLTDQTRYYVRAVTVDSLSFHRTKYDAVNNTGKIAISAGSDEDHAIYSANATFYNSSGGLITLNVSGGTSPTVRNSAGSSTVVQQTVTFTVTQLQAGSEVGIYRESDGVQLAFIESSLTSFPYAYNYTGDVPIYIIMQKLTHKWRKIDDTLTSTNKDRPGGQQPDPDYNNP